MQLSPAASCGLRLALASWAIALFEYLLMVPANRIGFTELSLPQLKIYLWASLCIMGAVYFIFRG